jgi:hypothetical protein
MLTPSLKVKRKIAVEHHKQVIDDLYKAGGPGD